MQNKLRSHRWLEFLVSRQGSVHQKPVYPPIQLTNTERRRAPPAMIDMSPPFPMYSIPFVLLHQVLAHVRLIKLPARLTCRRAGAANSRPGSGPKTVQPVMGRPGARPVGACGWGRGSRARPATPDNPDPRPPTAGPAADLDGGGRLKGALGRAAKTGKTGANMGAAGVRQVLDVIEVGFHSSATANGS